MQTAPSTTPSRYRTSTPPATGISRPWSAPFTAATKYASASACYLSLLLGMPSMTAP
jgi:hypothetical protein